MHHDKNFYSVIFQDKVEKELTDKAKSGELKITKPTAPAQKRGRWDETPKIEALGAGALTPSSQTPGSTQRKRLTLTSNISAAAAEVSSNKYLKFIYYVGKYPPR